MVHIFWSFFYASLCIFDTILGYNSIACFFSLNNTASAVMTIWNYMWVVGLKNMQKQNWQWVLLPSNMRGYIISISGENYILCHSIWRLVGDLESQISSSQSFCVTKELKARVDKSSVSVWIYKQRAKVMEGERGKAIWWGPRVMELFRNLWWY